MLVKLEPFPSAFYCEHESDTSRVFALVRHGDRMQVLVRVLDVEDTNLAHRVACALNALRLTHPGPALKEEVGDIERLLPEEQRAAYRTTAQQLIHRFWPAPRMSPRTIEEGPVDQFHSEDDELERSPDHRLAGMPGPVVRIWRLTEMHVHDPNLMLHAASSTADPTVRDEDEPDAERLVAAAGRLLGGDDDPAIPGADNILDVYDGSILDPQRDELAAFREAAPPTLDTGWRSAEA